MTEKPEITEAPTIRMEIFIAGDLEQSKQVCREWCMKVGACVTVELVDYIYTGGQESGIRVGLINYPRFPAEFAAVFAKAQDLADLLMHRLCQHSYTILTPEKTYWHSRRAAETPPAPQPVQEKLL